MNEFENMISVKGLEFLSVNLICSSGFPLLSLAFKNISPTTTIVIPHEIYSFLDTHNNSWASSHLDQFVCLTVSQLKVAKERQTIRKNLSIRNEYNGSTRQTLVVASGQCEFSTLGSRPPPSFSFAPRKNRVQEFSSTLAIVLEMEENIET